MSTLFRLNLENRIENTDLFLFYFNTEYMTNLTSFCPVKMDYGWSFSISALKMMAKSGLEKIFLKISPCAGHFLIIKWIYFTERRSFDLKYKFSNKNDMVSTWSKLKNIFSRPLLTVIFRSKIVFLDTDSILRVKLMYESVK